MSLILLLCVLVTGVAVGTELTPTVVPKQPTSDVYYQLSSPTITNITKKYTVVIDEIDESYHILTYSNNTLLTDIDISDTLIDCACVYEDYAILCTADNGTVLVYDLVNGVLHSVVGLPSNVYSISLFGWKLYAQTSIISVYDLSDLSDGNVSLLTTYDSSDLFKIDFGIYASDGEVYYTKETIDVSTIYSYDTQTNTSSEVFKVTNLKDFVVDSGVIYALTSDTNKLLYHDTLTNSGGAIDLKHNSPTNLSVLNHELSVTHTLDATIDLYDLTGAVPTYKTSLCSKSALTGRFDTPVDVYNHTGSIAVADYNNDRVQIFKANGSISQINATKPKSVAIGTNIVIASDTSIYVYETDTTYTSCDDKDFSGLDDVVVDCNDTIYAIDKNNNRVVYKDKSSDVFKTFITTAPQAIAVAPHGSVLYCLYSNSIYAYDNGARLIFITQGMPSITNATMDVDATGNAFILAGTTLYTYKRTLTGFELISTDTLNLASSGARKITVSSDGEVLLVDGARHQIFEIENTVAKSYTPTNTDDSVYQKETLSTAVQLVTVENDTFIYDDAHNYETTRIVKADTSLVLLSNTPVGEFYYVYADGPAYLPIDKATLITPTIHEYNALSLHNNTPLYKYPILKEEFKLLSVNKDASFKVVSNVEEFDWEGLYWSQIEYNGKIYYVTRNNVGLAPVDRVVDHGWAKLHSSVVGQKIKVYALSDDKSSVIGEYADGTEVKLLSKIDEASSYTQIQIGDEIGYVKTSELTTGGMTTAQIVILILILLGGTASVTILVISRKMHKRN